MQNLAQKHFESRNLQGQFRGGSSVAAFESPLMPVEVIDKQSSWTDNTPQKTALHMRCATKSAASLQLLPATG